MLARAKRRLGHASLYVPFQRDLGADRLRHGCLDGMDLQLLADVDAQATTGRRVAVTG